MKKIIAALVLVIVACAVLYFVGTQFTSEIARIWGINQPPRVTVSTMGAIIESVRKQGTLSTVNVSYLDQNMEVNTRFGALGVCNITAKHFVAGNVDAGIDLTGITPENISYDASSEVLTLTLPASRLLNCSLDAVRTQQYETTGETIFCSTNTDDMRRFASYMALNQFRQQAIDEGILFAAQENAVSTLTDMVKALTEVETVEIAFAPESIRIIPESCDPQPPEGFVYNRLTGLWEQQ
jgi:hypothetical protein